MRKLKLFFACLLMAVLSIGQMWGADPAPAGTTLFSENFSGYSANNVPSGSVTTATGRVVYGGGSVTYTSADNGTNKTMIYTAALASGTSPELLIGKSAGVFTIAGIPSGAAQEITVSFKQNAQKLTVSLSGTGYSTTYTSPKPTAAGTVSFDITVADGADATFTLIMSAGSSNVRVDDILVTVKTAGEGGGDTPPTPAKTLESVAVSGNPTKTSYTAGENFDPAGLIVTGHYSDNSDATITSGITWSYDPAQELAENQTSIKVKATVSEITSTEWYVVENLTVAEGPDVILDLLDAGWGFPKSKVVDETAYTNGGYTIKVAGSTGNGFRVYTGQNILLGKQNAYIELPIFSSPIKKIVVAGNSGGSGATVWNIFQGENAVSTAATGCTADSYTFNIAPANQKANVAHMIKVISDHNLQIKSIKIYFGEASSKQAAGLAYAAADAKKLVKVGGTLEAPTLTNPNGLTISYASSDEAIVKVNASTGAITEIAAAGKAVITASFAGNDDFFEDEVSYTIFVAEQAGTEADPLTEASAKALIDLGCTMNVYVVGTVASKTYYNSKTYTINLTDGFQYYYFYEAAGETVFETDYLKNGDIITAYGTLKKSGENYRLNPSYMVDRIEYTEPLVDISNTKATAYTVAEALALAVNPTSDLTKAVYIKGVVYDVNSFNQTNGTLDIYIKDAGEDNKFEFFKCAGIYDESLTPFADEDAVKIGNEVIGYGVMKYYSSGTIWEFDNNAVGDYLVDLQKPVTGVYISELEAQVEVDAQYTLTAHVWPINATNKDIDWTVKSGDAYASVDENGVVTGIAEGVAVIRATAHGTEFYKECTVTVTIPAPDTRFVANGSDFEAISGDLTPADIKFAAFKGDGTTEPKIDAKNIRIYKPASGKTTGGYLKLTALMGYKIDQVEITFDGNAKASYAVDDAEFSTVAYIDGEETLLTPTGLDAQSVSIVNLKNGSIDVKAIKVWYTGAALPIHHYFLGGTYETEFMQYGAFNYDGLKVYAAYDELETIKEEIFDFIVQANLMTYGNKKAEVYRNSVKIAEYDITVTESSKQNPALAYEPKYDEITLGDAWTAPAFSNPLNVVGITFSSNKTSVAKVTNEGVITLEGGCGTAVITAHFAETEEYVESTATYTIIVNEPAEDLSGTWVKATSIAAGDRIIIGATYQGNTKTMGGQNTSNRAAVASTYENLVLTPAEGTKTFTLVDAGDGKFAIQALNGKYLTSATSGTDNKLLEAENYENDNAKWTISINEQGVASIVAAAGNKKDLQYNSGNTIFSCYSAGNQKPVNIYKIGTPDYGSYQRTVTSGRYGTICLPKAGKLVSENVVLFEISYKESTDAVIYLDEVDPQAMEAGMPYIFFSNNTQVQVEYTSSVESTAKNKNGLYGTLAHMDDMSGAGIYMISDNQLLHFTSAASWLDENRAYIQMNDISTTEPTSTPGAAPRRRVAMNVQNEQVATGVDALNATEAPVKMIINGQLFILRGEKMYNVNGQLVK